MSEHNDKATESNATDERTQALNEQKRKMEDSFVGGNNGVPDDEKSNAKAWELLKERYLHLVGNMPKVDLTKDYLSYIFNNIDALSDGTKASVYYALDQMADDFANTVTGCNSAWGMIQRARNLVGQAIGDKQKNEERFHMGDPSTPQWLKGHLSRLVEKAAGVPTESDTSVKSDISAICDSIYGSWSNQTAAIKKEAAKQIAELKDSVSREIAAMRQQYEAIMRNSAPNGFFTPQMSFMGTPMPMGGFNYPFGSTQSQNKVVAVVHTGLNRSRAPRSAEDQKLWNEFLGQCSTLNCLNRFKQCHLTGEVETYQNIPISSLLEAIDKDSACIRTLFPEYATCLDNKAIPVSLTSLIRIMCQDRDLLNVFGHVVSTIMYAKLVVAPE